MLLLVTVVLGWFFYRDHEVTMWMKDAEKALTTLQTDKAEGLFNRIELLEPWRKLDWNSLAAQHLARENSEEVFRLLEPRREAGILDAKGWRLLANAYEQTAQFDQMETSLLEAYRLTDTDVIRADIVEELADYYRKTQKYKKAVDCLNELAILLPSKVGQVEIDTILLTTVINTDKGYAMSVAYPSRPQWMSEWQSGIKAALEKKEEATRSLEVGRVFATVGLWDLAEFSFQQVVATTPDFADAWALLAESRQQQGKDGREQVEKALAIAPESPGVRLAAGLYYRRQKDYPRAIALFESAGSERSGEPVWLLELARTQAEAGRLEEAIQTFERIIQSDPENADTLLSLALICLQYEYRLEDIALPAAEKAVRLKSDAAKPQDVLGQVYFALGKTDKALEQYHLAQEIDATYAPVWLHLGQIELAGTDPSRAREALLRTIELSANSYEGKMAARLLKQYFYLTP